MIWKLKHKLWQIRWQNPDRVAALFASALAVEFVFEAEFAVGEDELAIQLKCAEWMGSDKKSQEFQNNYEVLGLWASKREEEHCARDELGHAR